MTALREGIAAINYTSNSTPVNNLFAGINQQIQSGTIKAVRVKGIILTPNSFGYKELGEDNGIGTIQYDDNIEFPNSSTDLSNFQMLVLYLVI